MRNLISDAVEVKGSDDKKYKKEKLFGFGRGEFRVLITHSLFSLISITLFLFQIRVRGA